MNVIAIITAGVDEPLRSFIPKTWNHPNMVASSACVYFGRKEGDNARFYSWEHGRKVSLIGYDGGGRAAVSINVDGIRAIVDVTERRVIWQGGREFPSGYECPTCGRSLGPMPLDCPKCSTEALY